MEMNMLKKTCTHLLSLILFSFPLLISAASNAPVLLDYQREFSMLEEADNSIDIQIFADGAVKIHYPFFMRLAGDYRFQLTADETDHIMQSLQQLGVDRFDAPAIKQAVALEQDAAFQAINLPGQSVRIITDPDITHLSIATSSAAALTNNINRFSITGVRNNAELYPQVTALVDLTAALDILDALTSDVRMQRIEVAQ